MAEYERSVIFRLGRLRKGEYSFAKKDKITNLTHFQRNILYVFFYPKSSGGAKGPGIFFIIPCTDSYQKVDLRTVSFDVPPQEVNHVSSVVLLTKFQSNLERYENTSLTVFIVTY